MNKVKRNHDTKSISIIRERRTKLLYIFIISLTVIVIAVGYFFLPGILEEKKGGSPIIRQMINLTAQVGKLETDIKNKENELSSLTKRYYQQTGEKLPELSTSGLSEGQKKILIDKIKNLEDVSSKELLNKILAKNNEISRIKEEKKRYEALLPRPHIVVQDKNHYQIAVDFLVNEKGVKKEKAIELVKRSALFEPLKHGFRVWNFYSEETDEYGTFVTQGDAPISPNELSRKAKKKLVDEKENAIAAKNKLETELKILETKKDKLISQTKKLNSKIRELKAGEQEMIYRIKVLSQKEAEMRRKINSLFYVVDSKNNLIQKEIIKGGFLRRTKLNEISPEYFKDCIDLRTQNTIEIFSKNFDLTDIDEVTLYPKFYKRGIDYEVTMLENNQRAVVIILAKEKFKTERVVISVK